jgi:hypothetical protein
MPACCPAGFPNFVFTSLNGQLMTGLDVGCQVDLVWTASVLVRVMPLEPCLAKELQTACVHQISHGTSSQLMTILWSAQKLSALYHQYSGLAEAAASQLLTLSTPSLNSQEGYLMVQVLSKSEVIVPKAQSLKLFNMIQDHQLKNMSLSCIVSFSVNLSKVSWVCSKMRNVSL